MPADIESVVTRRLPWYLDPDANPIESLTAGQRTVMAVLRSCYRGATADRIATEARLSPAHARRCLNELARRGYAVCEEAAVQRGYRPTRARVWSMSPSEACSEAVAYLPWRPAIVGECPERVPHEFWWLFWSGANAADLRLPEHALTVADTMLSGPDVAARNWALTHLPVEALKQIRARRGYDAGSIAVTLDSTIRAREFRAPVRGDRPGYVEPIGRSLSVSGMRVASLPDLFASKLDVIMYRPKIRDYIDIAALDSQSPYTIEDGIRFHTQRYGTSLHSPTLDRIVNLLEEPGALDGDPVFEPQKDEVLSYLLGRVFAVRAHLATLRQATVEPTDAMRRRGGNHGRHRGTP